MNQKYKNGFEKYNDEIFRKIEGLCDETTFVEILDFPEALSQEGDNNFYCKYNGYSHYCIDDGSGRELHVYKLGPSTVITYVNIDNKHEQGITMLEKEAGRAGGSIKAYVNGGFSPVGYYSNSTTESGTDYYCVPPVIPENPKSIKPKYIYDDKFNMFDEFANSASWPEGINYDTYVKYEAFSSLFGLIRETIGEKIISSKTPENINKILRWENAVLRAKNRSLTKKNAALSRKLEVAQKLIEGYQRLVGQGFPGSDETGTTRSYPDDEEGQK